MADIDLKTLTPDTSLPTTGFLFGADSQAAVSPSVFTTQAVATTLLGSTTLSGATITADAPVLNLAQTWNNAAVTFTGLKFNVPTDTSASASLLMDLQKGSVSQFSVSKSGVVNATGSITGAGISATSGGSGVIQLSSTSTYGTHMARDYVVSWGNNATLNGSLDLIFGRRAAANLRFGAADAAAPVAQTLSVQSVVAGTTNTAGTALTITGSQGTGTGAGGTIIFQVAPAGSSGSAQNALATALTINADKSATFGSGVTVLNTSGGSVLQVSNNTGFGYHMAKDYPVSWGSSATLDGTVDVLLRRDAANTLALRNGTAAQTFRVYNTYDGTNDERGFIKWVSNVLQIGTDKTGTGTARALEFQTDGTTRLSFSADSSLCTVSSTNLVTGSQIRLGNATKITNSSNGVFRVTDSTEADFGRLQFGGTTSSFPALKRNGAGIDVVGADGTNVSFVRVPGVAVASLPSAATAGVGALSFVTDANMTMTLGIGTVVAGGGANKVPVYSDGTNWLIG